MENVTKHVTQTYIICCFDQVSTGLHAIPVYQIKAYKTADIGPDGLPKMCLHGNQVFLWSGQTDLEPSLVGLLLGVLFRSFLSDALAIRR